MTGARRTVFTLIMLAAFAFVAAGLYADPSPVGTWKTIDDVTKEAKSFLEITEKDGKLYGKIIKLVKKPGEDPNPLCTKCTGANKDKPILGMTIMWGLSKDGAYYTGGKIMDPDNGKTYSCKIKVVDGGKRLEVRGFIGISLAGRSQFWVKAD